MNKIQRLLRELDIKIEAYEDVLKEDRYIDWEDYRWAKQTKAWLTMPRDEIEDQTIDIDSIEELDEEIASVAGELASCWSYNEKAIIKKQNEILRALKHLNKEIQSIKEN